MTHTQFDLYVTALLKSIWQGEDKAPDCLGVKVEELYGGLIGNKPYKEVLAEIQSELVDEKDLTLEANTIPSPFSFVRTDAIPLASHKLSLDNRSYLFPKGDKDFGLSHGELLGQLKSKLEGLPKERTQLSDYFRVGEMMLSLLQYYTASIEVGKNGASLFDFARLTSAVLINKCTDDFAHSSFLFVKVDFSGIQRFIFDVISKGAAKSLKSRSLRIQLLSILTGDFLLQKLALSPANLIYIGGGDLYLLIPKSREEELENCISAIRRNLIRIPQELKTHGKEGVAKLPQIESLQIYIGSVEVPFSSLKTDFATFWGEVNHKLDLQRIQPYPSTEWELLFKEPLPLTSQTIRRKAEQNFYKDNTKRINYYNGFKLDKLHKEWSKNIRIPIGEEQNSYITHPFSIAERHFSLKLLDELQVPTQSETVQEKLLTHTLINTPKVAIEEQQIPKPFIFLVKNLPIWRESLLNEPNIPSFFDARRDLFEEKEESFESFRRKQRKMDFKNIIEFGHLSMFAYMRTGTDKLGVLKMDVDKLGEFFQYKIKPQFKTLIHTSAISRSLKWFFEGYMNTLLDQPVDKALGELYSPEDQGKLKTYLKPQTKEGKPTFQSSPTFRDNIYVIFSGGDDFFLVGAWDLVLEFGRMVKKEFDAFTKGALTLSAGVIWVSPKFPVSRFAQLVKTSERTAKNKGRNRIDLLGQTLTWEELETALEIRNTLCDLIHNKGESRAIIHKVRKSMRGFEGLQVGIQQRNRISLPRLWRLNYYLREVRKENQEQVEKEILKKLEDLLKGALQDRNSAVNPGLIAVGARLAEFMTKPIAYPHSKK